MHLKRAQCKTRDARRDAMRDARTSNSLQSGHRTTGSTCTASSCHTYRRSLRRCRAQRVRRHPMAVRRSPARLDLQVELHADEERGQRARQHAQPVGGAEYARARRGAAVHVDGEAHDVGGDEHQDVARAAERDQVTVGPVLPSMRPAARHRLCAHQHRSAWDGMGWAPRAVVKASAAAVGGDGGGTAAGRGRVWARGREGQGGSGAPRR